MQEKKIFIICGESSGDLHAGNLAKAIKGLNPQIKIFGVGGASLRQAGVEIYCDIKELAVFGFFDALKKLPKFLSLKKLILQKINEEKPDAIIFIDFAGFNLRLAKAINNTIPTIYYISPQVWASRPGRIRIIKKYIQKIIVIFKFEERFYKKYAVDADFVGYPLLDTIKPTIAKSELLNNLKFSESKITIALLPGSRKQEIENILPIMLKSAELIRQQTNAQFVVAKSLQVDWDTYNRKIKGFALDIKIVEEKTYDCLNIADFCLVCSGTATIETAIIQKPFLIIYKMDMLNYLLYRPQIRVPYIGMVNIVAGKKIIPEFIQFGANPKEIAREALRILKNPAEIERMKNNLVQVKASLGEKGATSRAARIILNSLK